MKNNWFALFLILFCSTGLMAQEVKKNRQYEEYVAQWRDVAQEHEVLYGIPAAISLAQGLLESGAGQSELARNAKNHFGIKCTSDWMGGSYYYDDDQKGECFRVYRDAYESWNDHAKFLKRDRYKSCFDIPVSDYAAWARQIRACGYATDPKYPEKLIRIIETYILVADAGTAVSSESGTISSSGIPAHSGQSEDEDFFKGGVVVPQPAIEPKTAWDERKDFLKSHPRKRANGHSYVIANQQDTYASVAFALNVKERDLRVWNDALGRTLHAGDRIYYKGPKRSFITDNRKASLWVHPGESVWQVSQREGIKEKKIRQLNGWGKDVDIFKTRQEILLKKPKKNAK